ncbi:Protein of unknown function [Bacillus cereus]|nr:Protein of unknown function [Bacillus cereus]SCN44206.1 Protein of unknown function [Bacillus wiedmannii]
MNDAWMNTLI